jgi:hypothetical protein
MFRIPRVCLVFVVIALFALLMAPMASARPMSAPSAHLPGSAWLGAALHWVEDLAGLRPHGPSGAKTPVSTKEASTGGCVDPLGRPRPCP